MDITQQLAETQKELATLRAKVASALDSIEAAIKDPNRGDASVIGAISYIVACLRGPEIAAKQSEPETLNAA